MRVFVQGIGVWAPKLPNWQTAEAVIRGACTGGRCGGLRGRSA
jgi:hypothetical protein